MKNSIGRSIDWPTLFREHVITYNKREGHRRKFGWACTCGVGAHERTWTKAFKGVAEHYENIKE